MASRIGSVPKSVGGPSDRDRSGTVAEVADTDVPQTVRMKFARLRGGVLKLGYRNKTARNAYTREFHSIVLVSLRSLVQE